MEGGKEEALFCSGSYPSSRVTTNDSEKQKVESRGPLLYNGTMFYPFSPPNYMKPLGEIMGVESHNMQYIHCA